MSDKLEIVRGSGNVFRDFGRPNADAEQLRALLAAEIIKTLDERRLTVRAAGEKTGIAAADSSVAVMAQTQRIARTIPAPSSP